MQYKATHRYADVSARKMRPFTQLIRGRNADEAVEQLKFFPNRGARLIEKVLKSAQANAEDRGARNVERMKIADARADGGPMMKRIRPMSRGMAFTIRRRFAHIHIGIDVPEVT